MKTLKILQTSTLILLTLGITTSQTTAQHDVEISGKITFDYGQSTLDYGVYGLRVYLFFVDIEGTNEPELLFTDQDIEGKTFDLLDEEGNFEFDFTYSGDLSDYDHILVWPTTQNAAAIIVDGIAGGGGSGDSSDCDQPLSEGPCERFKVPKIGGGYSATPMDTISFFEEAAAIKRVINGSSSTITLANVDGDLDTKVGLALRGAMLSREYLMERYETPVYTSLGYSMPQIPIDFALEGPSADQGQFDPQAYPKKISLKSSGLGFYTVAHEYGHYVNYQMWGSDSTRFKGLASTEVDLVEGWGQFYSFAVRNWANGKYGSLLEEDEDNLEEGPFKSVPYSDNDYKTKRPNVPRVASYLWNVYDGPNLGEFQAAKYSNGDNDDFGGFPLRVFTIMKNIDENEQTLEDFHDDYIGGLFQAQKNSIKDIKDFTDNPSSDKMRPIFTKNLTTQENSGSIDFSWDNQSYTGTDDYRNDEGAYHELYIENEDGLQSLSSQISYNGTSYTYNHGSSVASGVYQIRTYNSAGQSLNYTAAFLGASTPTGLEITNETATLGGPRLDWDDNPEAVDNYLVYRYRSHPPYHQPNTQLIGTTTSSEYMDITVAINGDSETFQYHVVAEKGVFVSDKSNAVYIEGDDASPFKRIADQEEKEVLPTVYAMTQNYPNPFNPATVLSYNLPETAEVLLEVYNILGRRVQTLVSTRQVAGSHQVSFDASRLSSGVYIARFKAKGQSGNIFLQEQKMTLIK